MQPKNTFMAINITPSDNYIIKFRDLGICFESESDFNLFLMNLLLEKISLLPNSADYLDKLTLVNEDKKEGAMLVQVTDILYHNKIDVISDILYSINSIYVKENYKKELVKMIDSNFSDKLFDISHHKTIIELTQSWYLSVRVKTFLEFLYFVTNTTSDVRDISWFFNDYLDLDPDLKDDPQVNRCIGVYLIYKEHHEQTDMQQWFVSNLLELLSYLISQNQLDKIKSFSKSNLS